VTVETQAVLTPGSVADKMLVPWAICQGIPASLRKRTMAVSAAKAAFPGNGKGQD
jgi:hypothetical protein